MGLTPFQRWLLGATVMLTGYGMLWYQAGWWVAVAVSLIQHGVVLQLRNFLPGRK